MRPAVVILGSGRCGTSTVARVCHERLGINMGQFLKKGNRFNPKGYYEDYVTHAMLVSVANETISPDLFCAVMGELYGNKAQNGWGIKDNWALEIPIDLLAGLKPELGIICERDTEAVVDSWLKYTGRHTLIDRTEWRGFYQRLVRERKQIGRQLLKRWPNTLHFDFTDQIEESEIEEKIASALKLRFELSRSG